MMVAGTDILLSWSGGKDSALALLALREQGRAEPVALLTTVTEGYERVSMHGVRRQLVRSQAAAVGAPLVEVEIPPQCSNDVYEARMVAAFASPPLGDIGGGRVRRPRSRGLPRLGFVVRPPRPGRMIVEAHVCSLLPRRPPLVREEFELRGERDRGPREPAQVSSPQPAHVPTQGRPFESVRPAS
jgi:hypothetical protein